MNQSLFFFYNFSYSVITISKSMGYGGIGRLGWLRGLNLFGQGNKVFLSEYLSCVSSEYDDSICPFIMNHSKYVYVDLDINNNNFSKWLIL